MNEAYVINKFYEHAGNTQHIASDNLYVGCCPICREGSSWGKKRRCYFLLDANNIFCHNCGWSSKPERWIAEIEGISIREVVKNSYEYIEDIKINRSDKISINVQEIKQRVLSKSLPNGCFNIYDKQQLNYYNNDKYVAKCISYIQKRRLDVATYKPRDLWFGRSYDESDLDSFIHYHRLLIPFYNKGNINWYQSRRVFKSDKYPKYLSMKHGVSSIFNVDNIDDNFPYIFITEGPIDAFFIRNGVSVAGIQDKSDKLFNSELQEKQLNMYRLTHKIVWLLDNHHIDTAAKNKFKRLANLGENLFIWPKTNKYKDLNEWCIKEKLNHVDEDYMVQFIGSNMKAKMAISVC
jgi:hypothetical protein